MKVGFSDVNLDISLIPLEPSQRRWFVKLEWRGLDVTCGKLCLYCVYCFHHWIRLGMAWILSCQGSLMLDHVFVPMSFFGWVLVLCDHFMLLFPFSCCFRTSTVM